MNFLFSMILCMSMANAQVGKKNLYRKPLEAPEAPSAVAAGSSVKIQNPPRVSRIESGNLPAYHSRTPRDPSYGENPVIVPSQARKQIFGSIRLGDIVPARIDSGLLAFPDSKIPVRAIVTQGRLSGSVFLGEASMEKNSKRIVVQFNRFRPEREAASYALTGTAYGQDGLLGMEGKHHSGETKYFTAELLAAFAAGYADSMVDREKTPFGQTIDEPSVANAGRKATANAMSRTADRFAEKVRTAPEFVTLTGPVRIDILIQDQPTFQN
jgi:hypothetical protein